jgi:hypothetical protein
LWLLELLGLLAQLWLLELLGLLLAHLLLGLLGLPGRYEPPGLRVACRHLVWMLRLTVRGLELGGELLGSHARGALRSGL